MQKQIKHNPGETQFQGGFEPEPTTNGDKLCSASRRHSESCRH